MTDQGFKVVYDPAVMAYWDFGKRMDDDQPFRPAVEEAEILPETRISTAQRIRDVVNDPAKNRGSRTWIAFMAKSEGGVGFDYGGGDLLIWFLDNSTLVVWNSGKCDVSSDRVLEEIGETYPPCRIY